MSTTTAIHRLKKSNTRSRTLLAARHLSNLQLVPTLNPSVGTPKLHGYMLKSCFMRGNTRFFSARTTSKTASPQTITSGKTSLKSMARSCSFLERVSVSHFLCAFSTVFICDALLGVFSCPAPNRRPSTRGFYPQSLPLFTVAACAAVPAWRRPVRVRRG